MKPSFDEIYMDLAEKLALRSHCVKAQVGAVLTKETRIVSLGYNGPPAGTHNCDIEWPEDGCARDSKGSCSLALHAEQNAILYAVKNNTTIEGCTLYVTLSLSFFSFDRVNLVYTFLFLCLRRIKMISLLFPDA